MAVVGFVKRKNMLEVLRCLRMYGPVTKLDIMNRTGLTAGTVNSFVNELIERGIAEECGISTATGGRKAVLYRAGFQNMYIVGVSLWVDKLSVGLFDFDLNIFDKTDTAFEFGETSVDAGIAYITGQIKSLLSTHDIQRGALCGVGVSVPGPVDYERGVILELPSIPSWMNVPLGPALCESLGIDVKVDNNNNGNALCLKWLHGGYDTDNLVYLSTFKGIGVGVLLDQKVYRGSRFLAGEIGHISIDPFGEKCGCGNQGCIELFAADSAIPRDLQAKMKTGEKPVLCTFDTDRPLTLDEVVTAAERGDELALSALTRSAMYLSLCIDIVIKSYDPKTIVLDSTWLPRFPEIKGRILDSVFSRTSFVKRDNIKIALNTVDDLFLKGAAAVIVEEELSEERENGVLF